MLFKVICLGPLDLNGLKTGSLVCNSDEITETLEETNIFLKYYTLT